MVLPGDDSDDESDGELEVEKKARLLDAAKNREVELAREEELQINIQGDSDDFRLPTGEVCCAHSVICYVRLFVWCMNQDLGRSGSSVAVWLEDLKFQDIIQHLWVRSNGSMSLHDKVFGVVDTHMLTEV